MLKQCQPAAASRVGTGPRSKLCTVLVLSSNHRPYFPSLVKNQDTTAIPRCEQDAQVEPTRFSHPMDVVLKKKKAKSGRCAALFLSRIKPVGARKSMGSQVLGT